MTNADERLFNRAAVFTDIHFGKHGDSEAHNRNCLKFVEWMIGRAKDLDCDTIFFLGDWFENQTRTRNDTMYWSELAITALNTCGIPVFWLIGNHDLFLKNSRLIHSLPYLDEYTNITLINKPILMKNVLLCPWLIGDEFAQVPDIQCKYVFGHFELPLFLMNHVIELQDRGGLHADHFYKTEMVFSGHFHKRQCKTNTHGIPVWYIGNTFPMDFNDANDHERGMMVLEWDGLPKFESWPEAPSYRKMKLSTLLKWLDEDTFRYNDKTVLDVYNDVQAADSDVADIKAALGIPNMTWVTPPEEDNSPEVEEIEAVKYTDYDHLVVDQLRRMDTQGRYDIDRVVEIYIGAKK